MNEILVARALAVDAPAQAGLALAFGVACVQRVRHLIVGQRALDALARPVEYVAEEADDEVLHKAAQVVADVAQSHPVSDLIDGAGSAMASATTGPTRALDGQPVDAAGYCAYAAFYAYLSSSVTDPHAYADEHA